VLKPSAALDEVVDDYEGEDKSKSEKSTGFRNEILSSTHTEVADSDRNESA
jgi:hypothetical protein